jgi:hypothetical protein
VPDGHLRDAVRLIDSRPLRSRVEAGRGYRRARYRGKNIRGQRKRRVNLILARSVVTDSPLGFRVLVLGYYDVGRH